MQATIFKTELEDELKSILSYWLTFSTDLNNGGFIGQVAFNESKNYEAEKGSVLNARILWTFSAAYALQPGQELLQAAKRAFDYLAEYFFDAQNEGIYWSINADKTPKDTKNQIYALAFAIYGMAEYYAVSKDLKALEISKTLYAQIQKHSFDPVNNGYLEAFTRDWKPIDDLRLSDKDANEKKTMNTHLHIAEAYANLYKVWPNDLLRLDLINILEVIETHFIDTASGHLKLFFSESWVEKPDVISYGHDIEAAWLLLQCAQATQDKALITRYEAYALLLTDATIPGIDADHGLWYEFDPHSNELVREKHWWPQAELMIGFVNAWQMTGKQSYLDIAVNNWAFTKKYIIDGVNGEWHWGINADYSLIQKDKVGFWKCPYHNGRACIEIINRINSLHHDTAFK